MTYGEAVAAHEAAHAAAMRELQRRHEFQRPAELSRPETTALSVKAVAA